MQSLLYRFLSIISLALLVACQPAAKGYLRVKALDPGTYEIYSIAGDSTLQYVSEKIGRYNEDLALTPGSYLVLADCSNATVIIHPDARKEIIAHSVEFLPPHTPAKGDIFSVHCDRYTRTHSRQRFSNRYSFNMLSGEGHLLVSMTPLRIDFAGPAQATQPQTIKYRLSGVKVSEAQHGASHTPYFVSSASGPLSVTQVQRFGRWQFMLPGKYIVSVNGTENLVDLAQSEAHVIEPAYLEVKSPPEVDLSLYSSIRGTPFEIEINQRVQISANERYPLLPGDMKMRVFGSSQIDTITLAPSEVKTIELRSVRVDLNCSRWEWECLGKREVMLYESGQHYPFLRSYSDLPVLFNGKDVEVEVEGSKGLRYGVADSERDTVLKVGQVVMVPKPAYKPGVMMDLVRMEAMEKPMSGYSYDIKPDHPTTFTMIAGSYNFGRYTTVTVSKTDQERTGQRQKIVVLPGKKIYWPFGYYVSEQKYKRLRKTVAVEPPAKGNIDKTRFPLL